VKVVGGHTKPVARDNGWKGVVKKPRILETEDRAARRFGGGRKMKRRMVRSRPAGGSQGGVRKSQAPIGVDQDSVKASENGGVLHVGPGVLTIKERDFDKPQGVYEIVERSGFDKIEISRGLIPGRASEVKVS
jgi:hypothetical protein